MSLSCLRKCEIGDIIVWNNVSGTRYVIVGYYKSYAESFPMMSKIETPDANVAECAKTQHVLWDSYINLIRKIIKVKSNKFILPTEL